MIRFVRLSFFVGLAAAFLGGGIGLVQSSTDSVPSADVGRWYSPAQVVQGEALFSNHCAVCHGEEAEGTESWRVRDGAGNYPPPPLNGSAHAWHHPLAVLEMTIRDGGVALGGVMPGFGETLDRSERLATIAFFQSYWSDEVYARWVETNRR